MRQRLISSLLTFVCIFFAASVNAGTQNITSSTTSFSISPGDTFEFSLAYSVGSPETTGVGIKLHFDSSKLDFIEIKDTLETELTLVSPAEEDSSDSDVNADTDKNIITSFGEVVGNFIDAEDMPVQLLTAKFKATSGFGSDTVVNFTGIGGSNHTVSFAPVNIALADVIPPLFKEPVTKTVEAVAALTPVTLVAPAVTDGSDGALTATADKQGPFSVGTHIVTWTATDSADNRAAAEQTVIVQDTTSPSLTVPADIQMDATGSTTSVELGQAVANDLVDGALTATANNVGPFSAGTHNITWTVTDAADNTATAIQKITITAVTSEPAAAPKEGGGSMPLILLPLLLLLSVGKRFTRLKLLSVSCALSVIALSSILSFKPIAANGVLFTPDPTTNSGPYLPSLNINIEEPQPESDEVGGHPLPFVDIQRVARPYKGNYACDLVSYDAYGWVSELPDLCAEGANELKQSAVTAALRFVQHGSITEGMYTVLYEGTGTLKFSGIARDMGDTTVSTTNTDVKASQIYVSIEDKIESDQRAGLRYQITDTELTDPIRNIRIVMPGSACLSDEGVWLTAEGDCTDRITKPFAEILADDRNTILFNPDYLRELKPYKSIRMMNMIKASPAYPHHCPGQDDAGFKDCLYSSVTWDMRAKMDDAVWGASSITPLVERYGKGAPIEVLIALANTLKADPWFTIPHSATDEYVTELSNLVKATLSPELKPYIEYSNETWNGNFWAAAYVRQKGVDEKLSSTRNGLAIGCPSGDVSDTSTCNQFWAGALYTAKRSKEIFQLWGDVWQEDRSYVRVLAGYTPNSDQTFNMLNYEDTADYVDVFAVAPYFEACRDRNAHVDCQSTSDVPQTVNELAASGQDMDSMVDSLFALTNNSSDRYGLDAMIDYIALQKKEVAKFNVRLYSYEGGQHFAIPSTNVSTDEVQLSSDQITGMRAAMAQANKDPRMKTAYLKLLDGWKAAGGESFTLYTMPQGYHKWGSFGIKSGLNAPLDESPKYDAAIAFQSAQAKPWFTDVTLRKEQCNLDVDGNGTFHAFTDGLLLQRYLSGFRDDLLIIDTAANGANRTEADEIEQYIEACLVVFDIDGNRYTDDADGTLALRYLLDFRGDTLIRDIADTTAYRKTAVDIEAYLAKLLD